MDFPDFLSIIRELHMALFLASEFIADAKNCNNGIMFMKHNSLIMFPTIPMQLN